MSSDRTRQIQLLVEKVYGLTDSQMSWIAAIVNQFSLEHSYEIINSNLIDNCMVHQLNLWA
jgi:hypothetical protein